LADTVNSPEQVMASFDDNHKATWLTRTSEFKKLSGHYLGRLYLIHSQGPYAYFTAMQFRDQIRYDFPEDKFL